MGGGGWGAGAGGRGDGAVGVAAARGCVGWARALLADGRPGRGVEGYSLSAELSLFFEEHRVAGRSTPG